MDDAEKALEALKVQIKKEIIDNYFAERRYLEEESQALDEEVAAYKEEFSRWARLFTAFYAAIGEEEALRRVLHLLFPEGPWPFYEEFRQLSLEARQTLLKGFRRRGFTAWRRYRNLVLDIYRELAAKGHSLEEPYHKILVHLRLLNEDIQKFNISFDFGLIAAQMEAMEGGGEVISGGLLSTEREELSTRMRFKRRKLTDEELPPPLKLPPLERIKGPLQEILGDVTP
jgi:hypothetical protein|uniref:Uncharacterized protein n=1 Tax=Desulfobacca acetoxidans TaxID=60893 RepID=A0A7C5AKL5_9BACT